MLQAETRQIAEGLACQSLFSTLPIVYAITVYALTVFLANLLHPRRAPLPVLVKRLKMAPGAVSDGNRPILAGHK